MANNSAKPMSTLFIRNVARLTRKLLKIDDDHFVNVTKTLDVLTVELSNYSFNYMILPDDHPLFIRREEAKTDVLGGTIYIKDSVYKEAAHKKYCRAHYTIAHEIGHFVLHRVLNTLNFARSNEIEGHKIYKDPEWQADTFASEFLMPYEKCLELKPEEIRRKYHVSTSAAKTRYNKIHK